MLRIRRSNRVVFLTICLSILVVGAGLLTWYTLTRPPVPPQATCGAILFPEVRAPGQNIQQVEHCFYQAYQNCSAMSMQVDQNGTDTSMTTFYWPHQQGQACQIIAQTTYHTYIKGNATSTETCQSAISKDGGLLFQRCSTSGDVFVRG